MEKNTNVPRLRFPEFEGEWELKKLGEIAEVNPKTGSLPNSFIYIDLESVVDGQLLKEERIELVNAPSRAQRLLSEGDILFQMVRPYQKNNLYFNYNGEYVASTGYAQIRTNNNPKYIYQYLHFQEFTDRVIERCTGTSYPAINSTDLSNIRIAIPVLPEQIKIASFLTAADNKLTQLKKKKSLLDEYKKGVMQKIFSQELRFKDDNGEDFPEWEEKRLGDIATFSKGKGLSKADISDDGEIECIRYGELYTKYNEVINEVYSKTNVDKTKLVLSEANDVIIPASGETQIDIATASCVIKSGVALGGDLNIIKTINNGVFLSYYLNNRMKTEIANLAQGISVIHLYSKQLALLNISIPSLPEQTKIANFLSAIDEKINHCGKQIERMEEWKKGLLQQMFC